MAYWAALFVSVWMYKVGEILVNNSDCYYLSDDVLMMMLGTTTIEVVGSILIAMHDLFGGESEDKIDELEFIFTNSLLIIKSRIF